MRISPNAINAYQTQAVKFRKIEQDLAGVQKKRQSQSASEAAEIKGAKFLEMLSKAERQFLADKFRSDRIRASRNGDNTPDRIRGRLLDIKA